MSPTIVKRAAVLLLLGLAIALGLGCASDPAATPAPHSSQPGRPPLGWPMFSGEPAYADPLFWRLDPDGGATLHLLGSIHFGPRRQGWTLPARIEDAFARSEVLVVEVDDRNIDQAQMQAIEMRHGYAPPGKTLADLVPASTLHDLEAHMAVRSQGIDALMPFRPWMVWRALMLDTMDWLGFSPESGVDELFLQRAGEREVIALETVDSQLAHFGRLSPELDALFLRDALDHIEGEARNIWDSAEAWYDGDESKTIERMNAPVDEAGELAVLREELLFGRNRAMSKRLAELVRDPARAGQEVFVVVGVAHFVGERNIRELLAQDGLHIEQLGPDPARRTALAPPGHDIESTEVAHGP